MSFVNTQNPKCKPIKNEQGSHWGLLPYDNGGWNMNMMKSSYLLSIFSLNLRPPFYTSTFTSNFLIVFLNVQTTKSNTSLLYIQCTLMPQILSLTFTLVYTWRVYPWGPYVVNNLNRAHITEWCTMPCLELRMNTKKTLSWNYDEIDHVLMTLTQFSRFKSSQLGRPMSSRVNQGERKLSL